MCFNLFSSKLSLICLGHTQSLDLKYGHKVGSVEEGAFNTLGRATVTISIYYGIPASGLQM